MVAQRDNYRKGRLTARPLSSKAPNPVKTGVQTLKQDGNKEGLLYVPKSYNPAVPAALAMMLHGAGGHTDHGLSLIKPYADAHNIILLAPSSRDFSWDIIASDSFGADVIMLDGLLTLAFEKFTIDPAHMAIGGFSDGASYALSIGLSNGDLFTHIIAFSPGFFHVAQSTGKPAVFISHGIHDEVLPINPCSRRIVPRLQNQGYTVAYNEFEGEHVIPADISKAAVHWFISGK